MRRTLTVTSTVTLALTRTATLMAVVPSPFDARTIAPNARPTSRHLVGGMGEMHRWTKLPTLAPMQVAERADRFAFPSGDRCAPPTPVP